jgi:hypothetical protein
MSDIINGNFKIILDNYINQAFNKDLYNVKLDLYNLTNKLYAVGCLVKINKGLLSYVGDTNIIKKYHRFKHVSYFFEKYVKENRDKSGIILTVLNDGAQMGIPCFSVMKALPRNIHNIPIPMGHDRGLKDGCGTPLIEWDKYIFENIVKYHDNYTWDKKINKIIFRGQLSKKSWKMNRFGIERSTNWDDGSRGFLYKEYHSHPLCDIGMTKSCTNDVPISPFMQMKDQQKYKYILNVGNNMEWAERLRVSLFMNSLNFIHEAECEEWFYKCLIPYEHFIPVKKDFSDLIPQIEWALNNDEKCQHIVKNCNTFANKFLSEESMYKTFCYIVDKYISLQREYPIMEKLLAMNNF